MKIGFTGTQNGMTSAQMEALQKHLVYFRQTPNREFHHGDCVGADEQAGAMAFSSGYTVYGHPPTNTKKRAFSKAVNFWFPPLSYIKRNHRIVDQTDILIATPKTTKEEPRSGTWATIRYAWRKSKPIVCIWPNGDYESDLTI